MHFDDNGIREATELRVLQYRTTYINGTSILSELDDNTSSSTTLDQRLRLVDMAYIGEDGTSLEFVEGNRNIWPGKSIVYLQLKRSCM